LTLCQFRYKNKISLSPIPSSCQVILERWVYWALLIWTWHTNALEYSRHVAADFTFLQCWKKRGLPDLPRYIHHNLFLCLKLEFGEWVQILELGN
jgi:hypothetical protein